MFFFSMQSLLTHILATCDEHGAETELFPQRFDDLLATALLPVIETVLQIPKVGSVSRGTRFEVFFHLLGRLFAPGALAGRRFGLK